MEFAAYTFRPKIHKLLLEYLSEFPSIAFFENAADNINDYDKYCNLYKYEFLSEHPIFKSGESSAIEKLNLFLNQKLDTYSINKNDPSLEQTSDLSPYLHFGQISSQTIALEVMKSKANDNSKSVFLEELIVRKELADNYVYYQANYDNFQGFPNWAQDSHNTERNTNREHIYTFTQLENAETKDNLWNAAQKQMVKTNKMHGYMRMYWAKKILEWTKSPEEAQEFAIELNDKYQIDGSDPNGYAGIAWSIGGVHDRAWGARPIFGKVRSMTYNSTSKKFNSKEYIRKCYLL